MEIKVKVQTPATPNYIIVGRESISIKEFTEGQLREIGAEWTDKLVKKAEQLRNEPEVIVMNKPWDDVLKEDR